MNEFKPIVNTIVNQTLRTKMKGGYSWTQNHNDIKIKLQDPIVRQVYNSVCANIYEKIYTIEVDKKWMNLK